MTVPNPLSGQRAGRSISIAATSVAGTCSLQRRHFSARGAASRTGISASSQVLFRSAAWRWPAAFAPCRPTASLPRPKDAPAAPAKRPSTPRWSSIPIPSASAWGTGFTRRPRRSLPAAGQARRREPGRAGLQCERTRQTAHLWVPYPARVDGGPLGKWLPTYQHDQSMCYCDETLAIAGTDTPWVFTSGYLSDKPLRFKLIDTGQPAAKYTVKLYFAEPREAKPGERVFSVRLQGKEVLAGFDIVAAAGGPRRALIKEFPGVEVKDYLEIALTPAEVSKIKQPLLCGFEALREGE